MNKPIEVVDATSRLNKSDSHHFSLSQIMQLVEYVPIAISITDLTGKMLYVNRQFVSTTGYSKSELIGQTHSIVSFRKTPKDVYKQLWASISNGTVWYGKLLNKQKNGERYLADVCITPMRDDQNEICYYMGSHRDISSNHVKQTELKNQNELFASVLNTVPSPVALLDSHQRVILDNLAYKTLLSDLHQEPMKLVFKELRSQLGLTDTQRITTNHFPESNAINIKLSAEHQARWFRCRFLTLEMLDDHVDAFFSPTVSLHTVVVLQEFTREHRRAEAQRVTELHNNTLQSEMLHAMQETMHGVFHQLQGPVNTIASAINMLTQRSESCSGLEPLNMAFSAGEQALQQLRQALPERPFEARQSVNLNQIVHEVSTILTDKLLKQSIDLTLSLQGTLPSLNAQPTRLRVALKQLLDNAMDAIVQARKPHRTILITTAYSDDELSLLVEDSGPGIAPELRLRVFEPFFSSKPANTEGSRGIGLSIVQQVVMDHHASIDLHTSKLGGCQVRVTLPRHSPREAI